MLVAGMLAGAAAAFLLAFFVGWERAHEGRIVPGVTVAGVPVGGLDRAEAESRLRATVPALDAARLVLVGDDDSAEIGFGEFGRTLDLDAMLNEAFAVGRGGEALERARVHALTARDGVAIAPRARFDPSRLRNALNTTALRLTRSPTPAVLERGQDGFFRVRPGTPGRTIDVAGALETAAAHAASTDPGSLTLRLPTAPVLPVPADSEFERVAAMANAIARDGLILFHGQSEVSVAPTELVHWVVADPAAAVPVRLDEALIRLAIAGQEPLVEVAPVEPSYRFTGPDSVGLTPGTPGRRLDIERTLRDVMNALESSKTGGRRVALAVAPVAPRVSDAEAASIAARMQVVSSWTTKFTPGPTNFDGENIRVPARILDGNVVMPGETFDFWREIGGISRDKGYGAGAAIIGGRTAAPGGIIDGREVEGALGGGICSTSTTLFNAALRAGLEMGARRNHFYYITRYPVGLDATVFRSGDRIQTMEFTNDTAFPVLIRGIAGEREVRFDLYSLPSGRTIELAEPVVSGVRKASDSIQFTRLIPSGSTRRAERPIDGFDVTVTRTVRDQGGRVLHQDSWHSHYGAVRGVLLVGGEGEDIVLPPGEEAHWPVGR